MLSFSFAPWNFVTAAVLAMAVLFRALHRTKPGPAFVRGWLFGVGSFGAGIWWIAESFQYRDISFPVAAVLTALLVAALALYPALFGWASVRFLRGAGRRARSEASSAAALWWLPAAWVLVEWLRGNLFSGFTWLQLGYGALDSPLAAFAPFAGSYALGLGIAVTAAVVGLAGRVPLRATLLSVPVVALLWGGGAVLVADGRHTGWTRVVGEPLRVLVVQGNVPQEQKWVEEMRAETLVRYSTLTEEHPGADLVVWPESAIPYFAHDERARGFLRSMAEAAERGGYVLLAGVLDVEPNLHRPLNAVVRIAAPESVEPARYYHKRKLVPFGERIPFDEVTGPIAEWMGFPALSFAPGADRQDPFPIGPYLAAASICYEITFGAAAARALGNAHLLVNVSNDAWFGDTPGPLQHLEMTRMRAIEQGRWIVRATNTGVSALIAPDGSVAVSAPQFRKTVLEGEISARGGLTPYVRWRDYPVLAVLGVMLLIGWRARRVRAPGDHPAPPSASPE